MARHTLRALALGLMLAATPAAAQDSTPDDTPNGTEDGGRTLMEDGARQFLRGLLQEVQPALDELRALADAAGPALNDFVAEMGPALREILDEVEDWSAYSPPEILPNGDIIIRRKPDPAPAEPTPPDPTGPREIEL